MYIRIRSSSSTTRIVGFRSVSSGDGDSGVVDIQEEMLVVPKRCGDFIPIYKEAEHLTCSIDAQLSLCSFAPMWVIRRRNSIHFA